jgi:eukaryotic translation initiation factor 2-alpha kinase 4
MGPKTPRKKKGQNDPAHDGPAGVAPASGQPGDAYTQAQEDEIEVLKAIFPEEFEEVEARGAWSVGSHVSRYAPWSIQPVLNQ